MTRLLICLVLSAAPMCALAQQAAPEFEVATIKPVDAGPRDGRFLRMSDDHTFFAKNVTLRQLIAAAYDVNPSSISGADGWIDSQKFVIEARTPGDNFPSRALQMQMLRALLQERFHLEVRHDTRVMPCYELTVDKDGPKVKSTVSTEYMPQTTSIVSGDHVTMPAKNTSMDEFAKTLQRGILDKPVVDKTGLTGRYDFDLEWAPDDSQFNGAVTMPEDTKSPPLVVALREQLGLDLKSTKGPVQTLTIEKAEKPGEN